MTQVNTTDIRNFIGYVLAADIIINNQTVATIGSEVDNGLADKLESIAWLYPSIFIEDEADEEAEADPEEVKKLMEFVHKRIDALMQYYSFSGAADDSVILRDIMNSILFSNTSAEVFRLFKKFVMPNEDILHHSVNTAILAMLLAIKSGRFPKVIIEQLAIGALLHDIGKLIIEKEYQKPYESLTADIHMLHPEKGYEKVASNPRITDAVKKIILMHHVWEIPSDSFSDELNLYMSYPLEYNGMTFSSVDKGLPVSIVQTASAFEILTSDTSTKKLDTIRDAILFILHNEQRTYGPGAFLLANYIAPFAVGEEVILNNGKTATIVEQTDDVLNPIVRMGGLFGMKTLDLRKNKAVWVENSANA